jgi:hypothetical protein
VRLFYALRLGYLLGAYQQRNVDDAGFAIAESQIPGLIMLHLGTLTARPGIDQS